MSHEFEKGFSVREPVWHGLAQILDDYPGREDAMEIAGHNFQVVESPLYVQIGDRVEPIQNKDWKALIRDDKNALISVVRGSYEVIQNGVLWDIVDAILGQKNVKYETAGVLKAGAVLWVLARLNEPSQVKGDNSEIYPYIMVSTTHDGTGGTRASAIETRVVCMNTFRAATSQSGKSGREFTFRHTKNVMDRIEDAKSALGLVRIQHEEFIQLANELGSLKVTNKGVEEFLSQFIPYPLGDVVSDRVKGNIEKARDQVRYVLESPTVPSKHRRTAYGLWSAGVEYLDHLRRYNSAETYFRRSMLDTSRMKSKLMKVAREAAEVR